MTPADISEVLRLHRLWLDGDPEGSRANLTGADLTDANLRGAVLRNAVLRNANLRNANLMGADMRGANLMGADMRGANLMGADMRGANLKYADLTRAVLTRADLARADLTSADMTYADLTGAILPVGWSKWNVSVQGDQIHIGCKARTRDEWDSFFDPACTDELDTPRDSAEWRRIRAAYLAACTWLDEGGLDGLNVGDEDKS